MPQLDKYIFLNQVLALIFFFFLTYIYIRGTIIPTLNTSLKYRNKKLAELISHDKAHWKLFNNTNDYFSDQGVNQLIIVNSYLINIVNIYKAKYNKKFIRLIAFYLSTKYHHFFIKLQILHKWVVLGHKSEIFNFYYLWKNDLWLWFWDDEDLNEEKRLFLTNECDVWVLINCPAMEKRIEKNENLLRLSIKENFRIKTYENYDNW